MRLRAALFLFLVNCLCTGCGSDALPSKVAHPGDWVKSLLRSRDTPLYKAHTPDPRRVLKDVNRYRRQHRLHPLQYSKTCQAAAKIQAEYNASIDAYGHDNPTYARAIDRLRAVKHKFPKGRYVGGENALRYTLSRDLSHDAAWHVFDRYHGSPHHDVQMLDPEYTKFGTASVLDAEGHLYNVEVFAN